MRQIYLLFAVALPAAVAFLFYLTGSYAKGAIDFLRRAALGETARSTTPETIEQWAESSLGYLDFFQALIWVLAVVAIASLCLNYYQAGRVDHYSDAAYRLGLDDSSRSGDAPPGKA